MWSANTQYPKSIKKISNFKSNKVSIGRLLSVLFHCLFHQCIHTQLSCGLHLWLRCWDWASIHSIGLDTIFHLGHANRCHLTAVSVIIRRAFDHGSFTCGRTKCWTVDSLRSCRRCYNIDMCIVSI